MEAEITIWAVKAFIKLRIELYSWYVFSAFGFCFVNKKVIKISILWILKGLILVA